MPRSALAGAGFLICGVRMRQEASRAVKPSKQRRHQGLVERMPHQIIDEHGAIARPWRAVDTLTVMERRQTISAEMRQAGEDFRTQFRLAHLDPLRAADLLRVANGSGHADGTVVVGARRKVWEVLEALGGLASPAGSCLWHVVGCESSLKEWGLRQGWKGRSVSPEAASGILVAALGSLERHFA